MLALRLKRTGRKKVSHYRVIAQEHRFAPTSGKVTAYLGSYNPHTKEAQLDVEQIEKYLVSGARPSDAAAKLFKAQGIKLPDWVSIHQYEDKKVKETDEAETTDEIDTDTKQPEEKTDEEQTELKAEDDKDSDAETADDEESKDDSASEDSDDKSEKPENDKDEKKESDTKEESNDDNDDKDSDDSKDDSEKKEDK